MTNHLSLQRAMCFLVIVCAPIPSWAQTYTWYQCKTDAQVSACKDGCTEIGELTVRINSETKIILIKGIDRGKSFSTIRSDCKIFDEENWDCSGSTAKIFSTFLVVNGAVQLTGSAYGNAFTPNCGVRKKRFGLF